MRRRRPTIRTRIVTLTVLPIIALSVLGAISMLSVTGELRTLARVKDVYETFGSPVDAAVGQIQTERRLSAAYLGQEQRTGTADTAALARQQRRTDRAVAAMRAVLGDPDARGGLTARQRGALDAMERAASGLAALRARVLDHQVSWSGAVAAYNGVVAPAFDVQSELTALQQGQFAREGQVVVELVRAREYLAQEDALLAGAGAAGTLTDEQDETLAAAVEDRRVFHRTYVGELPADSRKPFRAFEKSADYRALNRSEDVLLEAGAKGAAEAVTAGSWRTTTDRAMVRYRELCSRAALNTADRARQFALRELVESAVLSGIGVLAVVLCIWFSLVNGGRVARRLEELRDAADVLATRQLPDVMARLSAGEPVDAATEAPPLDFGDPAHGLDEIGQVGQALNTARRAAVEAAVRQATLRRGVFAVLLNIARRNQALVHRQAKLVDTLERRTTDADTLAELFRIDHLTTRMRRHAESLVILSGTAPSRRSRRPVPVVDVVAAAVGEIEDYTRVVVPPMPVVGVEGGAVADVVHLLAELLENATVFSPPHTQVTLRTGHTPEGFVLEIDDRGLGLHPEELAEANRTLSRPGGFDPASDERLGLYVVGRLAERHAIAVTLRESAYGGTTATVLLPTPVLASVPSTASTASAASAASGDSGGAVPVVASSGERRAPALRPVPDLRPAAGRGQEKAGAEAEERQPGGAEGPTSASGLPTRVRQASPAARLRAAPPRAPRRSAEPEPSAEEMRAVFGAFQRGLDKGRSDRIDAPGSPRSHPSGTSDSSDSSDRETDDDA
ncbi:putative sensor with HAMP domain containing protein [Actinobacteria bacterium OK074]|nr:putative sensor with HAMP domain containing protein [Actinobacteria bacterium OK074]